MSVVVDKLCSSRRNVFAGAKTSWFFIGLCVVFTALPTRTLWAQGAAVPLAQSSQESQRLVQVIALSVTVYAEPNEASQPLFTVQRGGLLTVAERKGDWLAVALGSSGNRVGWVRQLIGPQAEFALQELSGPGSVQFARDQVGDESINALMADRPGVIGRLVTLPPVDPDQAPPPEPNLPRESIPLPDRWRIMQSLGFKFPLYDPYNQNVIKGDLPVLQSVAPDLFFNLGITSDNLYEHRKVPIPVSQTVAYRAGANNIYGSPQQIIQGHTVVLSLGLTKGNTVFKPPDWEFRYVPAFQYNRVEVKEAGALNIDPARGVVRRHDFVGIQELFFDYHLRNVSDRYDFDSVRVGVQPFTSDYRGFLFQDLPMGIRFFGNRDNNIYQYNLGWFRRIEKDTNTGLNDLGKSLRDDDVFVANLYRQDFPVFGFTSQWTILHNRNRETRQHYDTNGFLVRPAFLGDVRGHKYDVTYFGYSGDGHFGWLSDQYRINLSTSTYLAVGRDHRSPLAERSQKIKAFFHASELSRDFSWVRVRGSFMFASGDQNPYDSKATGFDAIFENPQFAGADTSYFIRQGIPLIGGGGVALSGRNGILPSLRSSKEQGQSNFQNPGLLLLGLGADIDVAPELRILLNASYLQFNNTQILGVLRNERSPDRSIGWDYSVGIQWRPFYNQNLIFNASYAVLHFGKGLKQLYGSGQDKAHSAILNLILNF